MGELMLELWSTAYSNKEQVGAVQEDDGDTEGWDKMNDGVYF